MLLLLLMAMMIGWFEFQPRESVPHPAVCSLMSMAMFDGAHAELCAERMTMEFAAMEERLAAGASAARAAPGWLNNSTPATRQGLAAALEALQWQVLVWADIVLGQASETETTGFTEAAGVTAVQAATEWTMVPKVEIPKEATKHKEMEVDVEVEMPQEASSQLQGIVEMPQERIHPNMVVWNTLVRDLPKEMDVTSQLMPRRPCKNPSCHYAAHPVFSEYFGYCCKKCGIWGQRCYLLEDEAHGEHCQRCET